MKNSDYWRGRFEQLNEAQQQRGLNYFNDLEREYNKASEAIEEKITNWYRRFAKNNNITLQEAKWLLDEDDLKEFQWDVHEYIKYGKENAINGLWMRELENASARVHISRLEALKLQMQQQVEVVFGKEAVGVDRTMRGIYSDSYYHTAYEVQRGFNVGYDLQKLDNKQINKVISKPWTPDGKNFSDRIWQSKDQLVNTLHTELTQAIIRGDGPDKAIRTIRQKFNVSKNNAGRLVTTESAFFASAAQKDCFKSLDVERYEIVATLDNKTSEICQELDGKVFPMKDYEPGVTAPPFHCWCRTVTAPYFEDDFGERAARDADGKVYYVPDSMKYPEWKKSFVDGGSKEGLKELTKNGTVKIEFKPAQTIQEAEKYAVDNLGFSKVSFKDIDVAVANEVNKSLVGLYDEYPTLKGFVQEMGTSGRIKAVASAGMGVKDGRLCTKLTLSKNDLNDLSGIEAMIEKNVKCRWWTPKDGAIGVIKHELGHMLEYITTLKKYGVDLNTTDIQLIGTAFSGIRSGELSSKIKLQALKNLNLNNTKIDTIKNLSEYGASDSLEFLAEAVSESEPKRDLAKEVVRLLKDEMEVVFNGQVP